MMGNISLAIIPTAMVGLIIWAAATQETIWAKSDRLEGEIEHLQRQAISRGFAEYDLETGEWRWKEDTDD